ncbi:hypothetical protein [Xanthomonas sp. NCPPB 2632]
MTDAIAAPIEAIVDLCDTCFSGGIYTAFALSLLAIPAAWIAGALA